MFKKIIALFLFAQAVQAYSCYRLNKVADQVAATNGCRPVVLPPSRPIEKCLITFAKNEDVDIKTAKITHVSL